MKLKDRTLISILDRYIALNFLAYFAVCALALVGLLLLVQTFQMLHKFIDHGFPKMLWLLGQYYFYNIPVILANIFPVMTLVGASYCLVEMTKGNEMIALKASGVSIYRIIMPVFGATALIAVLGAANQEWFLPFIGPKIENFKRENNLTRDTLYDKYGRTEGGQLKYRVHEFNVENAAFQYGEFTRFDPSGNKIIEFIKVDEGQWLEKGKWACRGVHTIKFLENGQQEKAYRDEYTLVTDLTPDDLLQEDFIPGFRSIHDLRYRIKKEPERVDLRMALQGRFTHPLSAIILLLIGLPPVIGSERFSRNRVLGIGISLAVGVGFYIVSFVCSHLGKHGYIPTPAIAAWMPVVMFGALGFYFFDAMRT
ncbi:MAG: YjgP/YjgQ family permease [Planctomycetes bacterium]|nr:YjgP/YjgQ family permease [Planctomycetota bacterium]